MWKSFLVASLWLAVVPVAAAQPFDLSPSVIDDEVALGQAMPGLATQVLSSYKESDRQKYLDQLFRVQWVAGRHADASKTLATLKALRAGSASPQTRALNVQYEVLAKARLLATQGEEPVPFDEALAQAFRETFARLDDRTSALVIRALGVDPAAFRPALREALEKQKGKSSISLADALALIRAYQVEAAFRELAPRVAPLIAEDDARRYVIEKDIPVRTPEGATSCVLVVRPRSASGRLPALLNFTIYADPSTLFAEARRTASNGYAGVEGLTRGKGCSPDQPVPYEHDGVDAAAVIDWISTQPWSDGRVGMFGGSYEGFTQWAAAKHLPKALKALMPSVTAAPGIDVPMEGNVFQSFVYYWPFYTTNNKALDNAPSDDRARWSRMNREWYVSGRSYRSLDQIDGTPNPFFDRWLEHPAYDAFWQSMIPYGDEFSRIRIPVLTTTGFYDDAQIGALYYFIQHHARAPGAEHYLLIGPYDHIRGQRGTITRLGDPLKVLRGYETDPVAHVDLGEIRYQWFDFVFKGRPKPALLKNKVNYEVMGANTWKHVPSLAAMSNQTVRYYLSAARSGDTYRLSSRKPEDDAFIPQTVDLADRTDVDRISPGGSIVDKEIDTWDSLAFVSDPLSKPAELSGLFSARLDFVANRKDLDFSISLYELTPKGEYVSLSYYMARASHVKDRTRRQLLEPGQRVQLDFQSGRLTSRKFQKGSRLVAVLGVIKHRGAQINYGSGKDVSDETLADGKEPLKLQWYGDSFIDVPFWK
ncbi:CocE/NonD family hydrolase [Hyalangium versicolor]|uniref:CocE/NonD family hydrolase n=1 Tax=Hyalangium versicolor TaxID=2861190 RepID=UPI001CC92096|nr:CocE/NonD family hydrolase [Hyalangium versicolor]